MTSATEKLRRMLDERGVEHHDTEHMTEWHDARGLRWNYFADGENIDLTLETPWEDCTPEQAIAATLGNGTLTAEQVRHASHGHYKLRMVRDVDGFDVPQVTFDWQAIADELNAELGSGTCEVKYDLVNGYDHWTCGSCRASWVQDTCLPRACPNCGRKVVS